MAGETDGGFGRAVRDVVTQRAQRLDQGGVPG